MKEWVMPKYILTVNISSSGIDSCLFDDNLKTVAHVFVPLSNYSDEINSDKNDKNKDKDTNYICEECKLKLVNTDSYLYNY